MPSPLTKDKLFLFISGAGLVIFGYHPRKTGSALACMFLPLVIPGVILELDHSSGRPCRILGSQLYVIKPLIWPWDRMVGSP